MTPPVYKLSVAIIARDEESQIGDCLESVRWADEVVVADTGSGDVRLRLPFRFGVVTLTEAPQLFVRARIESIEALEDAEFNQPAVNDRTNKQNDGHASQHAPAVPRDKAATLRRQQPLAYARRRGRQREEHGRVLWVLDDIFVRPCRSVGFCERPARRVDEVAEVVVEWNR